MVVEFKPRLEPGLLFTLEGEVDLFSQEGGHCESALEVDGDGVAFKVEEFLEVDWPTRYRLRVTVELLEDRGITPETVAHFQDWNPRGKAARELAFRLPKPLEDLDGPVA